MQSGPQCATKQHGHQPVATPPPSSEAMPSTSIAKAPEVALSSQAAAAESSHVASAPEASSKETGAVFAPMNNYKATSSSLPAAPATTAAPVEHAVKPQESTIAVSYTTIGREVIEHVEVQVDVTVTAGEPQGTGAHHKRHHHHHAAHGIGGRRLR